MDWRRSIIFLIVFAASFNCSNGCQIEGTVWPVPTTARVVDTFRGTILDRSTTNIASINSVSYGEVLKSGPYLNVELVNSRFLISTRNEVFDTYEENETTDMMPVTVSFACTGGSSMIFTFMIEVIDTNNNAPRFTPSNEFVFTISPPVPPGFEVTGCFNDLIVRDIDLTTQRIDFAISENPYFMIEYDAASSTTPKEFHARLKTTTFIRNIPEPITLLISATDVDLTGDAPITTNATVTIHGNTDFELPEEPVFSEAFYLADYNDDHQVVLAKPISLRSGYDSLVQFTLEGEHSNNFGLEINENQDVSIRVSTPLADEVLMEKQILLVVRATREHTSGSSATVVVQLPEDVPLKFERAHYEGSIENNILQVPPLILSQGYEGASVFVEVLNEYSTFFTAAVQGNTITLAMTPLEESVVNENTFIYLRIVASTNRSTATTIVTLEIIKDDNITPVFNSSVYRGSYNPDTGLTVEPIVLVQGYDETVSVSLEGDYVGYFEVARNGPIITLTASTIPPDHYSEGQILLTIGANKPRTVGANAAVIITLPAARALEFEESTYRGSLQENTLTLEPIVLRVGYDSNVTFSLEGEYASYFSVSNEQSQVRINLMTPIPTGVILENNIVILTLSASGLNAVTTTTSVILDIIKDDVTTPVFTRNIYYGTYLSPLTINIEDITLAQGYDESVTFRLDGDHSQYFEISNTLNNIVLSLRSSIPENIIFNEKVLLFNVLAEKALTVGASATVSIRFPPALTDSVVMRFTQNTYTGTLDSNVLTVDNIVLSSGYAIGMEYVLTGEYSSYFKLTHAANVVSLSLSNPLPIDTIESKFMVLEIEARRERAVPVWTSVVIDIIKPEIVPPVFTEAYYKGLYNDDSGLQFKEEISLLSGYDETVVFRLEGEFAPLFSLVEGGNNSLSIVALAPISEDILTSQNHLIFSVVASKPDAEARAAIFIHIEKEIIETVVLRFTQNNYVGSIENGQLQVPTITLVGNNTENVSLDIAGDYAQYFNVLLSGYDVQIQLISEIPAHVIAENAFIMLEVKASLPEAVSGYTTLVIEIMKEQTVTPIFDRAYYAGEYSEQAGLQLNNTIRLIQGFDEYVTFNLDGDDSRWFTIVRNDDNSLGLSVINNGVGVTDRSHLVFSIVANKPDSLPVSAAIVISLTDFTTTRTLSFSQDHYMGSIEGTSLKLDAIILEGYSDDVVYNLSGDYVENFRITNQDGVITLHLSSELPIEIEEANDILIFTLEARAESTRTHTTIILEIVKNSTTDKVLVFEEIYYIGSYSEEGGLLFDAEIKLTEEFNSTVSYSLEGAQAQWFGISQTENSVSLTLNSQIPNIVLQNNQQLIFAIRADSPGLNTATATIVITIIKGNTNFTVLGFDQVTYTGSIENSATNIGPITLITGYTENVTFALYGDLASHFHVTNQGPVVNIAIRTPIPPALIPPNRILVLEIRASAPQAINAYATLVFEVIDDDNVSLPVNLVFDSPYYTGSYNVENGLVMESPISLSEGYDDSVQFALEGENAQWFSLVRVQNSVTVIVSSAIPGSVLASNNQLVFVITAQRANSATVRATIVISLTDEYTDASTSLGFDRVTYLGSIENSATNIGPITLITGYTENVTFALYGDLASHFHVTNQGPVVNIAIRTPIPPALIPPNRILVLEIRASAPQAINAYATLVFEVTDDDNVSSPVNLVFDSPYYTGSYNVENGLVMESPISLSEGYDDSVQFALEGENAQWFSLVRVQNSVTVIVSSAIPGSVLASNNQLVFVITAQRANSATVRATIVISLTDEYTDASTSLGFDRVTYLGSIENSATNIGPITLITGYTENVTFALYGDLASHFHVTNQGPVVNIAIRTPIPPALIPPNRILVLEIRASAPQAINAYATLVFEVIDDDNVSPPVNLVFDSPYYTGSYNVENGLVMESPISLSEGYDDSVQFALEGENAQWFSLVRVQNSVTVIVSSAIPGSVLASNNQLVFVITAQRANNATVRATIVISLTDEYTDASTTLGFDRVTYLGSIENSATNIGPITLITGYTENVTFALYGDLASHFHVTNQGPVVNIAIRTPIPPALIPPNRILVLEIRASAPQAINAYATLVFEVIDDDNVSLPVNLVFDSPYYTGSYNVENGLVMESPISLSEGYDDSVQFALEGENAQWFSLVRVQNSVTVIVSSAIPGSVLASNNQLVFVITAQRANSATVRATIVISLTDEYTDASTSLGFDRVTYLGSIENSATNIGPITLITGYTENVTFALYGDLASHFHVTNQGPVVNIAIRTPIPPALIPPNRILVLEIRASAPQAINAYATLVFEVIDDDNVSPPVNLVFDSPYYTGSYNVENGLVMESPISLSEGYDDSVQFALEGENAQWFSLVRVQNSVTVIVSSAIPGSVLASNYQLVFVITAQRANNATVRATIVISLTDEYTDASTTLGFDRVTYLGSIENSATNIGPITLITGYTENVTFALYGDLTSHFHVTNQGPVVNIAIRTPIPPAFIPPNRILLLEIRASAPQAINAYATLVFEVIDDDNVSPPVNLVFDSPYYTGSYNVENGLVMESPISLSEGYDDSVQFALEGENAQWFSLVRVQNSVTVIVSSAIPGSVLASNNQLVFVITAQRANNATVRATIVISLTDEYTDASTSLGFDRVTYLGSIENSATNIGPITLITGYTENVTFALYGDLASHFHVTNQGPVVNIAIRTPIPPALIPPNRILVLEIRASAPQAINAYATLVFEVIDDDNVSLPVNLVFDSPYYTGSYNVENGLVMESPISLSEGYDDSVQFALEGENAQWFSLVRVQNSVTVIVSSAIPGSVLASNNQLVFVITAQRANSATVRATIVISLTDEYTDASTSLGFDRVTYLGSIENSATNIGPITLITGYTENVTFALYGDLASHFHVTNQGPVVNIAIRTPIPPALIPPNRLLVLEIRASAPQAINAYATLVFEVIDDDNVSLPVNLVFDSPYYTGSYNVENGLVMESPISLSEGYDDSVQFALEGENAQWFSLVRVQNSVTVIVSSAIPGSVLASNNQLVFVITAQRANSATVRATIVISLTDEYTDASTSLGFDRVTYLGSIENSAMNIGPITLITGYTENVTFALYGDLASHFHVTNQGPVVNIAIRTPIPPALIPPNRILVLEIRASAPQAINAYATLVFEVIDDDNVSLPVNLVFDSPYYTGSYNVENGLVMESPISLSEGYDDSVQFALEGENAQWFSLVRVQNSVTVIVSSAIPGSVLASNNQLVFVITAQRANSATVRATIVISLTDEYTDASTSLGFDRVTYLGSIENSATNIGPITLITGYTENVTFALYGDLASHFHVTNQGPVVNIAIRTPIPPALIPPNRLLVLEIRASAPQAINAYATLVFEVIDDDNVSLPVNLVFDSPYYTGSYNVENGLVMESPISLSEGYDDSVQFALEGENAQWFSLVRVQNSVTVIVSSAIPGSVLASNNQLVFVITAQRANSATVRATIVISLTDEYTDASTSLGFDRVTYLGSIENSATNIGPITLITGYTENVTFALYGDLASHFHVTNQGPVVNIAIRTPIPPALIPPNRILVLEIRASAPQAINAYATLVFEVIDDDNVSLPVNLVFDSPYYTGSYNVENGLVMESPISLSEGYDDSVQFALEGENAQWFSLVRVQNSVTVIVSSAIPGSVLASNNQLVFVITAQRANSATVRATIVISLTDEYTDASTSLGFDRVTYLGSIENSATNIGPITLITGYTENVTFTLYGDLASHFHVTNQGPVVNIAVRAPIPPALIPPNRILVLEIRASAPQAINAYATLVFEVIDDDNVSLPVNVVFDSPYYTGSYNVENGLVMEIPISLSEGYDDSVQFALEGENAQWFSLVRVQNSVTVIVSSAIPGSVLASNNQLVFVITAQRANSATVRATIVISLTDEYTDASTSLGFDRVTYFGSIENSATNIGPITLITGYTENVTFALYGDLASHFHVTNQGPVVNIAVRTPIPPALIPPNRILVLEIRASAPQAINAYATLVFEVIDDDNVSPPVNLVFDSPYYTGSYNVENGLVMESPISLSEGYDDSVQFALEGENAQWFSLVRVQNSVTVIVSSAIPGSVLASNNQLVFVITAQRANSATVRATIVISLSNESQTVGDVSFEKVLYEGIIQVNEIRHESIIISGYNGTTVDVLGEHASLFVAHVSNGEVSVQASGSVTLPADVTQLALELHAAGARAVLLLNVLQSDVPALPSVTFSSESYVLNVDIAQTGLIGRVSANADNGEAVTYSLATEAHLQTRLSINNEGELYLSAPANSGVYTFQVIATTVITRATGTATVHLTVEAVTVCGDDDIVVPPLIVIDRDEEEPHRDLVVLDPTHYGGCHFTLTNRWPVNQTWLYVDETGLHSTAIDREHQSIAFMTLSQVQVELILNCETAYAVRTKRSERSDRLDPYDYGTNKWILTDTIPFNSRRSLVNLIVNDINDNAPIFDKKDQEPLAVGYPIAELEERILPRSLVELRATDADIGENAALTYWSSESVLAVAPSTGFVHVRSGARLQQDQVLTVSATDRLGEGLTGSIRLVVKLLDLNNIAVVTVRDAFLDDETNVLTRLSDAVGYEVRTLRSVVISDDIDENVTRNARENITTGASLQLYVYGVIQREPVAVDRLTTDISNNAAIVSVISTVSLEDHLEDSEITILERDIGLLVATIVLSIILFILILLIAIWFFLRWRKNRNYDEFTDDNSLASRNASLSDLTKPTEDSRPRLNIEDLKRSERRLQEMLNVPIEEVTVEPMTPKTETPLEAILDFPLPETSAPIVIQSIDKLKDGDDSDDEFGERNDTRRKSVVTFNENVEKIIHVEDDTDSSSHSGYEIYRL